MTPEPTKIVKQRLRKEIRQTLISLSDIEKERASSCIRKRLTNWLENNSHVHTVANFANLPIEPQLLDLLDTLPQLNWVFPHSEPNGVMHFYKVSDTSELKAGLYGIMEPIPIKQNRVQPTDIDCFLCPAFGYTNDGARLGKGGGYYDRLLANRRSDSTLIGVSFSQQLFTKLPTENHDIQVNLVITD